MVPICVVIFVKQTQSINDFMKIKVSCAQRAEIERNEVVFERVQAWRTCNTIKAFVEKFSLSDSERKPGTGVAAQGRGAEARLLDHGAPRGAKVTPRPQPLNP